MLFYQPFTILFLVWVSFSTDLQSMSEKNNTSGCALLKIDDFSHTCILCHISYIFGFNFNIQNVYMNADMMMVLDVLYIFGTVVIQQSQG